jgi:hypothetical protein
MPLLSYEIIKEFFNVNLLYLLNYADIESSKTGYDSIFFSEKSVFVVEYKSSIQSLNVTETIKKVEEGIESLFFKDSRNLSSLYYCSGEAQQIINSAIKTKIKDTVKFMIANYDNPSALIANSDIAFNVCIISPLNANIDQVDAEIRNNFLTCDNCQWKVCRGSKCIKKPEGQDKIKLINIMHLKVGTDFTLESLYNSLTNLLG